ncbi:MAG: hypothetical protein HZC36_10220 [Armatimonadetes bacterium]|nr:hypothetical protein [Armatimonadota bacterium]
MILAAAGIAVSTLSPLLVRSAEISLIPPEALPLGGYTARKESPFLPGGEDLKLRVIVLEQQNTKVAIASAELLTIPESLAAEVRKRLPATLGLFLAATHTHCAPDSQMLNERMKIKVPGIALFSKRWLDWYADRIATGIKQAMDAAPRVVDGMVVKTMLLPLNRARRAGGHPDPEGTLVSFFVAGSARPSIPGETPGLLGVELPAWFHYAAHATFHDSDRTQTSGDWPGRVARQLGAAVLQGAIGDVSPRAPGSTPEERIANFAETVGRATPRVQQFAGPKALEPFRWLELPFKLDPVSPHPEFAKVNKIPDALAKMVVGTFAPTTAKIYAFRIGKIAVVGVPGEPSGALGWRIRNYGLGLGFSSVMVVSHVNGWIGYVLEPADYDRGGYEATLGFHGRTTGEKVVEAGQQALLELSYPGKVVPRPSAERHALTTAIAANQE